MNTWTNEEEVTLLLLRGYTIQSSDHMVVFLLDGEFHREDGPAIVYANGAMHWYRHGNSHREDGPAIVSQWRQTWCRDGKRCRHGAPAVVYHDGSTEWLQNGRHHREDGPAIIWHDGALEWWLDGNWYQTRESWLFALEQVEVV